ncbi:MAG TPA: AI-2E family transporter [Longimicrobiaceae bacterium]|nr:AI-2E family transporter [Longimicrobiaceae bacterium]
MGSSTSSFVRWALIAGAVALGVVLILALLWYAGYVLLLLFAAVLVGVFLHSLSAALRRFTGLSSGWSLAAVVLALLVLFGLSFWLFGASLADQASQLAERVPQAVENVRQRVEQHPWARQLLAQLSPPTQGGGGGRDLPSALAGIFTATLSGLVNFIIVLVVGLYLAANPGVYTGGLVRLVPSGTRERAREVLHVVGYTLRWWLIGRFAVMAVNGALTGVALWIIGVPLAFSLGLLTGLLNFIPNFGPILAAIPAVLLALLEGPTTALYVVILYIVIQNLEGFVLTPLVQQRTVSLPPAAILLSQVLLGVLVGTLGVLVATPLAATVFVLVKMLYVEDTLDEPVEVPGEEEA